MIVVGIHITDKGTVLYRDSSGKTWNYPFAFGEDGFATIETEGATLGLGAVVVMHCIESNDALFVQKAPKQGYPHSNLWAFPGGMVRKSVLCATMSFDAVVDSVIRRVEDESGIRLVAADLEPFGMPVVTSYPVKGIDRFVLVLPFRLSRPVTSKQHFSVPRPRAPSIREAAWRRVDKDWRSLAPANCVIAAQAFLDYVPKEDRWQALEWIAAAIEECNRVANKLKVHILHFPEVAPPVVGT